MRVIYQAGPLFSEAERVWHRTLSVRLRAAGHAVVWPGDLLSDEDIRKAGSDAVSLIFTTCRDAITRCSCVVALLDGTQVDDGTAWEIGYAHARGAPVYGVRTDSRMAGDTSYSRMNSMIQGCLEGLAGSVEELVEMLDVKRL